MMLYLIVTAALSAIPLSPGGPYDISGSPRDDALNIHVISHSHDDVGWLKTVDECFQGLRNDIHRANVKMIYDAVLEQLDGDSRTFQIAEIAYFSRWWRRASLNQRTKFKELVAKKRITFVGGGWVQHDEAVVLFSDAIDQLSLGHGIINRIFGASALPAVAWQLDPFGHSRWSTELFADSGMIANVIGRVDSQEFAIRQYRNQQEFVDARGLLMALMPDGYGPPAGFDFSEYPWVVDEAIADDPELDGVNVEKRMSEFRDRAVERWKWLSGNSCDSGCSGDVMFMMGSDFQHSQPRNWFDNLDKIIHYSKLLFPEINVFYSTPETYFKERARKEKFPVNSRTDLFPYGDGEAKVINGRVKAIESHSYWTGYYSSRTGLKKLVRDAGECLRVGELLLGLMKVAQDEDDLLPLIERIDQLGKSSSPLFAVMALRDALATSQHHDAVTGTEKFRVFQDYEKRLIEGMRLMRATVEEVVGAKWEGCGASQSAAGQPILFNPSTSTIDFWFENSTVKLPPLSLTEIAAQNRKNLEFPERHEFPGKLKLAYYPASNGTAKERNGQAAGAYIFRPACPEGAVAPCEPLPIDWTGSRVHARRRRDLEPLNVRNRQVFEVNVDIPKIPCDEEPEPIGKEVVLVFKSFSIDNGRAFYTDSQGRDLIKRERDRRPHFDLDITDPISGNLYPVNTMVVMNDTHSEFSVSIVPDRPMAVGSLKSGELTFLLHRRLFHDDNRGVGEALNQTDSMHAKFLFSFDLLGRRQNDEELVDREVMFPVQVFKRDQARSIKMMSPIIDPSVSLLTLRHRKEGLLLRFAHKHARGKEVVVDLGEFSKIIGAVECEEMLITGVAKFGFRNHTEFYPKDDQPKPEKPLDGAMLSDTKLRVRAGEIRTVFCRSKALAERDILAGEDQVEIRSF